MNFWGDPLASSASISGRCLSNLLLPGPFDRPTGRQAGSPSRAKDFFRPCGDQPRSISAALFPQKCRSKSSPKIGRRQIDDIYAVSIGYRKSYGGFGTFEPLGHAWRVRFLGREASGYDRRSSPSQKNRPKSSPKIGRRQIDEIYAASIGPIRWFVQPITLRENI